MALPDKRGDWRLGSENPRDAASRDTQRAVGAKGGVGTAHLLSRRARGLWISRVRRRAAVWRGRAAGIQCRLAQAEFAFAARVHAAGLLRASGTLRRIGKVGGGACRIQSNRMVDAGDYATAKAITAVGGDGTTALYAFCGLRGGTVVRVWIVWATGRGTCPQIRGIAFQIPIAAVVAHAGVAIKEAVLFASVHVVAGNAGSERRFVVVERTDALGILKIDLAVFVIVDSVGGSALLASTVEGGRRILRMPCRSNQMIRVRHHTRTRTSGLPYNSVPWMPKMVTKSELRA